MSGRLLPATLVLVALVSAVVGSLGAPLITAVSAEYHVSLAAAQWTLTIALLSGVVATPVLGRLGSGSRRRPVVLVTLAVVAAGGALSVTSTAGIGVGYPLSGLLTDLAGVHAAYALGLAVNVLALAAAALGLPHAKASEPARVDWTGGVLLAVGLLPLLIAISQTGPWREHPATMGLVTAAALAIPLATRHPTPTPP